MHSVCLNLSRSAPSSSSLIAVSLRPRPAGAYSPFSRPRALRRLLSSSASERTSSASPIASQEPAVPVFSRDKSSKSNLPRVVVLGCGWAGFRFLHEIDTSKAEVTCISPRNHFVFTPLLPSTTVGTLEFRCIIEPVRTLPGLHYLQADCTSIEEDNKIIHVRDDFHNADLRIPYDYLVISCGARANTFGVPGVEQHAHFLKDLHDARAIRERLLECFERASSPALNDTERRQLLTFVCVGGGPTSIEFAGELHDFIQEDVAKWYPDLVQEYVKIVLVEATDHLLGTFDAKLSDYVMSMLKKRKIVSVLTSTQVKEVKKDEVVLKSGDSIPCGLVVWSTGVSSNPLIRGLIDKGWVADKRSGRLLTDDNLRVLVPGQTPASPGPDGSTAHQAALPNVFAMGDCARPSGQNFPPTAQVAQQQGKYLGKLFNKHIIPNSARSGYTPAFMYRHSGMLAYIGGYKALADVGSSGKLHWYGKGLSAWLFWRSAYFTKLVSLKNKLLVPMFWFKTFVFGRDISRF